MEEMEDKRYQELLQILTNSVDDFIPIEFISEQINSQYLDLNENNYFHYLSNYTFKEYCFYNYTSSKNEIITNKKYKSLLSQYLEKIISFVNILISINCNLNYKNIFDQTPLELCLIKQNYYMAKEYLKYEQFPDGLLKGNLLNILYINNCLEEECIDFLIYLFKDNMNISNDIKKEMLIKTLDNDGTITLLISIFKDYNDNIYKKFKKFIKINCIEYLKKGDKDEYIISSDEETKNKIKAKSVSDLNNFCITQFYYLSNSLIELGADINYIEFNTNKKGISAFMYLMAYPCTADIASFIIQYNININYQDFYGRTPLFHLINNKKNISNISIFIYNTVFDALINNKTIDVSKRDINGISPFLLCLINEYYDDAKVIYAMNIDRLLLEFNLDILLYCIIKMDRNEFNESFIISIKYNFESEINFDSIDNINNRTILHYFFMFFLDSFENFTNILRVLMNLTTEYDKKDIFNRNCLFYLFIDYSGDPKNIKDPFMILEYCLSNELFKIVIDEKDIFGNNLLFYSVKGGFIESVKTLIKYGASINDSINNEGNNIYTTSLMVNEEMFFYLYNIRKINNILDQNIFITISNFDYFIETKNNENENLKNNININEKQLISMYDFFHNPELILTEGYDIEKTKIEEKKNIINKIENENEKTNEKYDNQFTIINLLNEQQNTIINKYINDNFNIKFENPVKQISIKIKNKNIIDIKSILENPTFLMQIIDDPKKCIYSNNVYKYSIYYHKSEFIKKFINEKNKIELCKDYLEVNDYDNVITNLNLILDESKDDKELFDLKNKEGQNIFHILAMTSSKNNDKIKNIYNKLKKYEIDNYFDSNGNNPMYYACNKLNKEFIEIFGNCKIENGQYSELKSVLFIESKNINSPLEQLYKHIDLEDNNLLNLVIELTLKVKLGYILYILKYLIKKYNSTMKNIFLQPYKDNLQNSKYINKIIGIYQYLINELYDDVMVEDEKGNDPFILCVIHQNFDFLFDVLLPEKRKKKIIIDTTNKEGKSVIHLIIESKIINKNEMLLQMLKEGFPFNIKDIKGFYPIDYAYFNHEKEIINTLRNKYFKEGLPIKINSLQNFYRDSDLLYKESILVSSKYQQCDDLYGLVYNKFKFYGDNNYKVCVDKESIPYNTTLVRGNIGFYESLLKKFTMQLIENTKTKKYIVAYINIDDYNENEYDNFKEAENQFKEIFKEKTNNDWDFVKKDKTNFRTNCYKYYFFDYDFSQENDIYDYLKITINNLYIKKNIKYNGDYKVRDLIYYLARKAYTNRFNNENNTREIIKNYKKKAIQNSIYILDKIEKLFKIGDYLSESDKQEKAYLLNCYLELIPFSIAKAIKNKLQSTKDINEEKGRITTFYFIENILKIFLGAIKNLDEINPLDYIINSLGCNIIELKDETEEKKYIINYLRNTGASSIKNIFKITESMNDINFNPKNFKKRYIFFHGTKAENILGILSEGLKISPAQAKFTGNSYGEGIYLSDSYNVSIQYSKRDFFLFRRRKEDDPNNNDDKTFILLVEAALGEKSTDYTLHNTNFENQEVYTTEEGYGIFKSKYMNINGVIVVKNQMNVRVKYIIEV